MATIKENLYIDGWGAKIAERRTELKEESLRLNPLTGHLLMESTGLSLT